MFSPVHASSEVPEAGAPSTREARRRVAQPGGKAAILREADVPHPDKGTTESFQPQFIASVLPLVFKMERPIDYEPRVERSIAALAEQEGRDLLEYLYDHLLEEGGSAVGVHLATNYADGNLDACREMLMDGNTVMGLSDAGAHVNLVSDMSFPTFNLVHWVRDRSRGERLPIELVLKNPPRARRRCSA